MIHGKLNIPPVDCCMQKPSDETLIELGIDGGRFSFFPEFCLPVHRYSHRSAFGHAKMIQELFNVSFLMKIDALWCLLNFYPEVIRCIVQISHTKCCHHVFFEIIDVLSIIANDNNVVDVE
jgi:hypothetical protein